MEGSSAQLAVRKCVMTPHAHNGGVVLHLEELTCEGNLGVSLCPSADRGAVSGGWASLSAVTQGGRNGAEGPAGPVAAPSTGICVRLVTPFTPLALPEGFGLCWVFQLLAPASGGWRVHAGPVVPGEREDRPQRESSGRRPDSWLQNVDSCPHHGAGTTQCTCLAAALCE